MRGILRVYRSIAQHVYMRRLMSLLIWGMLISTLLVIGSCPELLEMFPHRHLGVVAAGHDATPLEALEHLIGFESGSAHHHTHGEHAAGVSLVSPTHGSLLGLNILIPSWLTLLLISLLIAELVHTCRTSFAGCIWPPLAPPPRTTI